MPFFSKPKKACQNPPSKHIVDEVFFKFIFNISNMRGLFKVKRYEHNFFIFVVSICCRRSISRYETNRIDRIDLLAAVLLSLLMNEN